jgi:hypothetical protein
MGSQVKERSLKDLPPLSYVETRMNCEEKPKVA